MERVYGPAPMAMDIGAQFAYKLPFALGSAFFKKEKLHGSQEE
jgi:hypothetical protein